jgi:hypothetical protein
MSSREAREIAAWLRQVHGDTAEAFCRRMIKHFQNENRKVVPEWEIVLCMLQARAVQEYQNMAAGQTNRHDSQPPKFFYFPVEPSQDR